VSIIGRCCKVLADIGKKENSGRGFNVTGVGTGLKRGVVAIEGCWPNVRTVAQPSDAWGIELRTACQNLREFWQS
jgi:hypothetical protein